jgi:hypothetical protein
VIGATRTPGSSSTEELSGLKNLLSGSDGRQQFRAYYDDSGAALLVRLLCNTGESFKECNQVVEGEPEATALESKMFVITRR